MSNNSMSARLTWVDTQGQEHHVFVYSWVEYQQVRVLCVGWIKSTLLRLGREGVYVEGSFPGTPSSGEIARLE